MKLFLKSFIIGLAKIIPGVSGAMIAVSFGLYDKLIDAITCFFDNKKENFKFLLVFCFGILVSITFFSNLLKYLIDNYYLITMLLFLGFIVGGTLKFLKNIKFSVSNLLIIFIINFFVLFISYHGNKNNYNADVFNYNNFTFFIAGIIEIFSSIVPGISGTAILMLFGIYDNVLHLFANILNFNYVIENIKIYISYGIGMIVSFIFFSLLISYVIKKYRNLFDIVILGLSISSIIILFLIIFSNTILSYISLVIGIMLFFVGVIFSYLFS